MVAEAIPSRDELREMVSKALARTHALAEEEPGSKLPPLVAPQLEFIAEHLEQSSPPPYADRRRINIGLVAVRNFEDADPEYARWLKVLDYSVQHWEQIPGISASTNGSFG